MARKPNRFVSAFLQQSISLSHTETPGSLLLRQNRIAIARSRVNSCAGWGQQRGSPCPRHSRTRPVAVTIAAAGNGSTRCRDSSRICWATGPAPPRACPARRGRPRGAGPSSRTAARRPRGVVPLSRHRARARRVRRVGRSRRRDAARPRRRASRHAARTSRRHPRHGDRPGPGDRHPGRAHPQARGRRTARPPPAGRSHGPLNVIRSPRFAELLCSPHPEARIRRLLDIYTDAAELEPERVRRWTQAGAVREALLGRVDGDPEWLVAATDQLAEVLT